MAEYGSMFIVGALAAILFFGGWHGPVPVGGAVGGAVQWVVNLIPFVDFTGEWAGQYIANLIGCVNLIAKASLAVILMIWIRWTFPRLRIDQVITVCWKYCVPIAAICFLGVLGWEFLDLPFIRDFGPQGPAAAEHWSAAAQAVEAVKPAAEAAAALIENAGGSS